MHLLLTDVMHVIAVSLSLHFKQLHTIGRCTYCIRFEEYEVF